MRSIFLTKAPISSGAFSLPPAKARERVSITISLMGLADPFGSLLDCLDHPGGVGFWQEHIDRGANSGEGQGLGPLLTNPLIYQTGPKTSAKSGCCCSIWEKRCISGRSQSSRMVGIRS